MNIVGSLTVYSPRLLFDPSSLFYTVQDRNKLHLKVQFLLLGLHVYTDHQLQPNIPSPHGTYRKITEKASHISRIFGF